MKTWICAIWLLASQAFALGNWPQREFMICAGAEPLYIGNINFASDISQYRDANLNLVPITEQKFSAFSERSDFHEACANAGLKTMWRVLHGVDVDDPSLNVPLTGADRTNAEDLIRHEIENLISCASPGFSPPTNCLTDYQRNAVAAFTIGFDEPFPSGAAARSIDLALDLLSMVHAANPSTLTYINLLPYNNSTQDQGFANWQEYANYVDLTFSGVGTKAVSCDYYPFINSNPNYSDTPTRWNDYGTGSMTYFRTLHLFSQSAKTSEKVFWWYVLSSGHAADKNFPARFEYREGYEITLERMRFQASAGLTYGAKGIRYFTYGVPVRPAPNPYRSAYVDAAGNKTDTYYWAQSINGRVRHLGKELIELEWKDTYHQSSIDPQTNEGDLQALQAASDTYLSSLVSGSVAEFAIGVFEKNSDEYLLVFNKDIENAQDVTISLKEKLPIWQYEESSERYTKLADASTITLQGIPAGDVTLLRLANPDLSPIVNLLLLD